MRIRVPLFVILLSLCSSALHAQTVGVKGKFVDPATHAGVPAVKVTLARFDDTTDVHHATALDDGSFTLSGLQPGGYRLEGVRLGYTRLRTIVRVDKPVQDLGVLAMVSEAVNVRGITVTESPAPAVVHGDTTEFRASAVKINRDATAEDLVQKMPGVTMESGQVKVQGEAVQQVLVNGRPFFGSDPTAAMRNLPAEVVDRIQVYDRGSDQAEFSGFDDSQSQKTMNFIMRNAKAKFGKVYGGGGDDQRYQAGGNASVIRGTTRLTAIGMSNNINQQNFSPQDLVGALTGGAGGQGGPRMMMFGGPRPGGGGGGPQIFRMGGGGLGGGFDPGNFFVGQQGGVSTTHSGGLNLTAQLSKTFTASGSAFFNQALNDNTQSLAREYVPPQDSTAAYVQSTRSNGKNANQRLDGRFEWTPDSLNSAIYAPRLYYQNNRTSSLGSAGYAGLDGTPLAASNSDTRSTTYGNNLTNKLTLRHRFATRGRNVSADLSWGHTLRGGGRAQQSLSDYDLASPGGADTLDLVSNSLTVTNAYSARIALTEPLAKAWQAQLIYNPSFTRSAADARALGFDALTHAYDLPDSGQSNSFLARTHVQNGGIAALYTHGVWRWLTNLSVQSQRLQSEQTYPASRTVDQTFGDILPSMQLNGSFTSRRSLRLAWNTATNVPGIGQLQNVVDRSNPLALTAGNASLRESYTNNVSLRFTEADPMHSKSRFVFVNVSRTSRPIGNATFTAVSDTTIEGVAMSRGTQLTVPLNLDEPSWNGNAFGVYSRPAKWLKSIVSLNAGGSFTQTPTRIGSGLNIAKNWALRTGAVFASNISPNLDFTLSYQGSYNLSRNSLSSNTSGDYYAHTLGLRLNIVGPHGVVVRDEVNHSLQSGVGSAYGRNAVLWNTTLGKKFLKDNRGELRVTLTDALDQDRAVGRSITESYVQDTRDRTLGRFAQAVFTYSFK